MATPLCRAESNETWLDPPPPCVTTFSLYMMLHAVYTFDEHPEEVGQMEVMQKYDNDAGSLVGLAPVQLQNVW